MSSDQESITDDILDRGAAARGLPYGVLREHVEAIAQITRFVLDPRSPARLAAFEAELRARIRAARSR